MFHDHPWIKDKHCSAMFTNMASSKFSLPWWWWSQLRHFALSWDLQIAGVPVLSVASVQLVCLNDSMRVTVCRVTKAGDTGMDCDMEKLLRSSSLRPAVSSSSSDYNINSSKRWWMRSSRKKPPNRCVTRYRETHCWFIAEDIDHISLVMVTGDKESGMSSSGQGSSWRPAWSPGHPPHMMWDSVLSHGALSSIINTRLCHLLSLITVIPLSQRPRRNMRNSENPSDGLIHHE